MTSTKPYDVVLFGATSFVGELVSEYYLRNYPVSAGVKWAIAARSEAKLDALKERLASEVDEAAATLPTMIADSTDQGSLDSMVAQAKVILTTVGPYNRHGNQLVATCAREGVHLCDLTGESIWVRDTIDKYHAQAETTGAKIVHSCGIGSIAADMGVFFMVDHMKRTRGVSPDDVRCFFSDVSGSLSGGTVASAMDIYSKMWSGGSRVKKMMNDPLLLTYPPSEGGDGSSGCAEGSRFKSARGPGGLGYDSMAKSWTAAGMSTFHDLMMVYRSASILGYPDTFRYKQVMSYRGLLKGMIPALLISFFMTLGGILFIFPPTRKLIARCLPAPGEGPSKEAMNKGYFWIDVFAKARADGKDVVCRAKIGSDKGDPGYMETAKMFAECGLCLALEEDQIESKEGGVLTTATAMGIPLIDRLRSAGITFEMIQG